MPEPRETVPAVVLHDTERALGALHDAALEARPLVSLAVAILRGFLTDGEPGRAARVLEALDGAIADAGERLP